MRYITLNKKKHLFERPYLIKENKMCCGKKKNFTVRVEGFSSMSVEQDYVLLEFIGKGSQKLYRVPEVQRTYMVGGALKFVSVYKDDVDYFLKINKNRIPQFKVRNDYLYQPKQETQVVEAEALSLDDEEIFYEEHRSEEFEALALTDIKNIGAGSARKLKEAGIETVEQLSKLTLEKLIEITSLPEHKALSVMEQMGNVQL